MAIEARQATVCIKKVLRSSIRISYRCASEHPILLSLGLLLYLLYRSSPGFFAFLVSSSPVIICTTLLLGILLSYGSTNLAETYEDGNTTREVSAFKVGTSSGDSRFFEADRRFLVPEFKENRINFKGREIKETVFGRERANEHAELDDDVPLLRRVEEDDERIDRRDRPDNTLTPFPSMVNFHHEVRANEDVNVNQERKSGESLFSKDRIDKNTSLFEDVHHSRVDVRGTTFFLFSSTESVQKGDEMEAKLDQERVFTNSATSEAGEVSEEKPAEGVARTSRSVGAVSVRQRRKLAGIRVGTTEVVEGNQLDASLGSPWARAGSHDGSSGFDSDRAESSSPDASMTDIAPVLDEIDPLLGPDSTRTNPVRKDDSDNDSHISSQDPQIEDDSNDEVDNNEVKNDGDEKKKDKGKDTAFLWTADDEKNLMDLGYSEMERNRRLEILIARRRSRKSIRFELDKNLIDFDINDSERSVDDLSRFRVQVPPISVPRRNPFDFPYDSDEGAIPGSAPSILHSRRNPFDLPFEQSNDNGVPSRDNLNPQEFMTASHQDMFFKRHDSFNFGRAEANQERRFSRLKPYFVPETVDSGERSTSNFQRQFSDESKLSVVTESDTLSSAAELDDHKDLIGNKLHREHESPTLQRQDSDLADVGSECSDGINSVDVELDNSDIDDREIPLQHFVFERSQEREAYLASMKGKGHEESILEAAGSSKQSLHVVPDLLSWEDGDSESSHGPKSSLEPHTAIEFPEWVSSARPAEEHESRSGDFAEYLDSEDGSSSNTIVLGANHPPGKDGSVDFTYSGNAVPLDNLNHGSMEALSEPGQETLPVISRDLHPIPEERVVENFNVQEPQEAMSIPDSATGLTGLHVIEEHFAAGFEGNHVVIPLSHPQEGDASQHPSLEPAESSNPFVFTSLKPEADGVNKKEETAPEYLVDSDDEADKIYPEPIEDNGISENFLLELDAVGDFRMEQLRLDQQVPDLGLHDDSPANGAAANSLISPLASGSISLNFSEANSRRRLPLINNLTGTDPEFGWSFGASHGDLEQTVYNPRKRILEVSPFEEMDTAVKQLNDETEMPSTDVPSEANLAVGSSELEFTRNDSVPTKIDGDMVILDAKSLEDIESALKQVSDGVVNKCTLDDATSQVSGVGIDSEPAEGPPRQQHVVDAKSVDDIYAAFNKLSDNTDNSSLEEKEFKDGSEKTEESISNDNPPSGEDREVLDVLRGEMKSEESPFEETNTALKQLNDETEMPSIDVPSAANLAAGSSELGFTRNDSTPTKTDGEMVVLDAKSLEDIESALKQASDGDATSLVSGAGTDPEPAKEPRPLHVVDAKSVDDIYAAFNELSDGIVDSSLEEKGAKDKLPSGEDTEVLHALGGKMESEQTENNSNMSFIDAKSVDDISAALKKLSDTSEVNTIVQVIESNNAHERREESEKPATNDCP